MISNENKKRMISGIKPSYYSPTLGNYIGAIKPFVDFQDEYEMYIFIADLHALTVYQEPSELRQNIENLIATYLAAGLNPDKVILFKQSDVAEHNQLEWILNCNSNMGELSRMAQYKAKVELLKEKESIGTGIYTYPILMAADILLYDADYVPTGIDQKQHVELARDLAERFNKLYGETFKLPIPITPKVGAKIMSLSNPTKKMSKSESDKGTIYLLDNIEVARKKIMKALTDCEDKVYYDPENKPGVSNLLTIYCALTNKTIAEAETEFKDAENYGVFKRVVADVVCNELAELQAKIDEIKHSNIISKVLSESANMAKFQAKNKILEVYKTIGIK